MGAREAKKYISDLHRKQKDPNLWPDFLTGLPHVSAIVKKVEQVYPKLGQYGVSYVRIANIHPYLIKYGPDHHSEIIQWAAASLKTTAEKYGGFVGSIGTHAFVAVCKSRDIDKFLNESSKVFEKKAHTFYNAQDLKRDAVLSFERDNRRVDIGLMKLISASIKGKTDIPKDGLISHLSAICARMERENA